jgi:ABC-type dipeptide/oligopeptide/nickel transport system permease component
MILPWITLAAVQAGVYTRLTRGQLLLDPRVGIA